jgi:hypothetical protein
MTIWSERENAMPEYSSQGIREEFATQTEVGEPIQSKLPNSKWRLLGSSISLAVGILSLIAGLATVGSKTKGADPVAGLIIILGALAYRSRKKVFLGLVSSSKTRRVVEIVMVAVVGCSVLLQDDALRRLYEDPVPNVIIPLWVLVAYIWVSFGQRRAV